MVTHSLLDGYFCLVDHSKPDSNTAVPDTALPAHTLKYHHYVSVTAELKTVHHPICSYYSSPVERTRTMMNGVEDD